MNTSGKGGKRKNSVARDLRTPKYKLRVIPNKSKETEDNIKDILDDEYTDEDDDSWIPPTSGQES